MVTGTAHKQPGDLVLGLRCDRRSREYVPDPSISVRRRVAVSSYVKEYVGHERPTEPILNSPMVATGVGASREAPEVEVRAHSPTSDWVYAGACVIVFRLPHPLRNVEDVSQTPEHEVHIATWRGVV